MYLEEMELITIFLVECNDVMALLLTVLLYVGIRESGEWRVESGVMDSTWISSRI